MNASLHNIISTCVCSCSLASCGYNECSWNPAKVRRKIYSMSYKSWTIFSNSDRIETQCGCRPPSLDNYIAFDSDTQLTLSGCRCIPLSFTMAINATFVYSQAQAMVCACAHSSVSPEPTVHRTYFSGYSRDGFLPSVIRFSVLFSSHQYESYLLGPNWRGTPEDSSEICSSEF